MARYCMVQSCHMVALHCTVLPSVVIPRGTLYDIVQYGNMTLCIVRYGMVQSFRLVLCVILNGTVIPYGAQHYAVWSTV
jgi:hypothetical protein